MEKKTSFLTCCPMEAGSVFSVVGAGGKTSLLFQLGREVKEIGGRCLLTTTTRIYIPQRSQYDTMDLSGGFIDADGSLQPCIHVAGRPLSCGQKMTGLEQDTLSTVIHDYFLTVIEADGAAGKSLKGWEVSEPVIPPFTSHTIGVVDIQMLGKRLENKNIHRPHLFFEITGSSEGEIFDFSHLKRLIQHPRGIFRNGVGEKILYFNKVESSEDLGNIIKVRDLARNIRVIGGSLKDEVFYA